MKISFKLGILFCLGLLSAILIYPILHELGHIIAILVVQGEINEVSLFSVPYVSCSVKDLNQYEIAFISLNGNLFPYFISEIIKVKNFWVRYIFFTVRYIVLYSFVITLLSMMFSPILFNINDDIIKLLSMFPSLSWCVVYLYVLLSFRILKQMKQESILKMCYQYFGFTE